MGTLWAEKHNSRTRKGKDISEWPAALHIHGFQSSNVARLYNVLGRLKLSLTAERLEETVAAVKQYFISESKGAELSAHEPAEEART